MSSDAGGLGYPVTKFRNITPDDTANLDHLPDGLYVSGAGTLTLLGVDNVQATLTVTAGSYHPLRPKRIMATGTSATGIVTLG